MQWRCDLVPCHKAQTLSLLHSHLQVRFGYGRVTVDSGYSLLFELVGDGEAMEQQTMTITLFPADCSGILGLAGKGDCVVDISRAWCCKQTGGMCRLRHSVAPLHLTEPVPSLQLSTPCNSQPSQLSTPCNSHPPACRWGGQGFRQAAQQPRQGARLRLRHSGRSTAGGCCRGGSASAGCSWVQGAGRVCAAGARGV